MIRLSAASNGISRAERICSNSSIHVPLLDALSSVKCPTYILEGSNIQPTSNKINIHLRSFPHGPSGVLKYLQDFCHHVSPWRCGKQRVPFWGEEEIPVYRAPANVPWVLRMDVSWSRTINHPWNWFSRQRPEMCIMRIVRKGKIAFIYC